MQHRPIRRLQPNDQALSEVLTLIRTSFAFMTGRIDPPSSMHQLIVQDLSDQAQASWILAMGDPVQACVVASPLPYALYLGKMAVDAILRGQGVGWLLVAACVEIAREMGHDQLELQVRIELVENQQAFAKMGFVKVSENYHPGYGCVTEISMQKILSAVKPSKL
jgi:phosphinothricin acetyltransferase